MGGAECTRSSLLTVQMDAAPVSTAAVASSRPREDAEGPHPPWNVPGGSYRPAASATERRGQCAAVVLGALPAPLPGGAAAPDDYRMLA